MNLLTTESASMIYAPGTYVRVLFIDKQQCFFRTQKLFGSDRPAITILIVKVSEEGLFYGEQPQ